MAGPSSAPKRTEPASQASVSISQAEQASGKGVIPALAYEAPVDVQREISEEVISLAPGSEPAIDDEANNSSKTVRQASARTGHPSDSAVALTTTEAPEGPDSNGTAMLLNGASDPPAKSPSVEVQSPKKRRHPDEPDNGEERSSKKVKDVPVTPKRPSTPISPRFPSPPEERASPRDKEKWQGWCEIESDPAYISAMMRLMGVKGVSVRQVYAVDELQMVAQPLYGLILLYRYRQSDGNHEVSQRCPDNVWFANQLPAQNSCATLAMFNIIMNADNVELGANLQHFKDFTSAFTPYLRGEAFASFQFVKRIHNSFAKKMDMLEDDMHLSNKVKRNKTSGRRGSGDSNSSQESIEENAHHFIAFVPIDGHVWKLDGMDYQPVDIGAYDPALPDSWLEPASTRILDLMAAAGDQDYSLLSVAPSPVLGLQKQLCKSYAAIRHVESRLDGIQSDWRSFVCGEGTDQAVAPGTPSLLSALGVTQDQLASVELEEDFKKSVEAADSESLLARRAVLVADQQNVENQIFAEMDTEAAEDSKAKERQWDYGPVIHKWLEMLAEVGHLEANIDRFKPKAK